MNLARSTWVVFLTLIASCTNPFPITSTEETLPLVLMPASKIGISDERQDALPDYRPCEEALRRVSAEPAGSGAPVPLGQSTANLTALIVPGVGRDCFEEWMDTHDTIAGHVGQFGYRLLQGRE
ncbi:hypothetical protein [Congregibacter sp.]|uniref:hypothetical protein n=1 Tax=Congregibacter sp. TaxID=2744308 RepID=UPI003F6CD75F